jgi:Ca-activated chloride channel family protein
MPSRRNAPLAILAGVLGLTAAPCALANDELPGTGCLRAEVDGRTVDFPLKHTKFDVAVTGPVAQVRVTQTFRNPCEETIEAVYVFPLSNRAAVNDFEMRVGDRTIRGLVERRDEARRRYEDARRAGHVAALLEQERPNVFTQSVANILPGNEIDVTLTYVETVPYDRGAWELAIPTVVGPRFNPPGTGAGVVPAGFERCVAPPPSGSGSLENPPFLPPGVRGSHDLEIAVDWDAGVPIAEWESPTHRIDVRKHGRNRAVAALHPMDTIPDKDFVLRARAQGDGADAGVLAYHDGREGFVSVLLHPKLDLGAADLTPKEMIFVLDCSGSMSGEPIAAAKTLVRHALTHVNPGDTFQIIRFSERASGLAAAPIAATPENVKRGLAYLERLQGEGGTMMIEGIRAALDFAHDPSRLRIVMFLTDGYIGNEAEILGEVRARIGAARLFAFGVGSSVNRHLLDGLAEEGRGEVQYFLPGSAVPESVGRFYDRVRNPYLTDVELVWHGADVEDAYPARIPDLFGGTPLAIHARYARGGDAWLEVRGRIAGRPWKSRVDLDLPRSESGNPALGALWARARIADLERQDLHGVDAAVAAEITRIGLGHRLVTKYTSFVAVEEKLVVSDGMPKRVRVPVEMPAGVSWEGVFGEARSEEAAALGVLSAAPPPASTPLVKRGRSPVPEASHREADGPARPEDFRASRPVEPETGLEPRDETGAGAELRSAAPGRVVVRVSADRAQVRAGDPVTLTVTLENRGGAAVDAAATLALGDGRLRLRVVDATWKETRLGAPPAGTPFPRPASNRALAPGEARRFTIRLSPRDAAFLAKAGVYHLFVEGGALGAASDSNRITLRVVP